jgi:hypothetical protein
VAGNPGRDFSGLEQGIVDAQVVREWEVAVGVHPVLRFEFQ